ncbi:hypothetical protein TorRG33x02_053980 [Trema orientale]|uniref:Uncharacterized protein n=1 Tax=Trema orientale TaxID=63057 RepID=A0A2P5FM09_TREOI|nr:hypothetical protein TorRG33x02_053980 [Trema orientale]
MLLEFQILKLLERPLGYRRFSTNAFPAFPLYPNEKPVWNLAEFVASEFYRSLSRHGVHFSENRRCLLLDLLRDITIELKNHHDFDYTGSIITTQTIQVFKRDRFYASLGTSIEGN